MRARAITASALALLAVALSSAGCATGGVDDIDRGGEGGVPLRDAALRDGEVAPDAPVVRCGSTTCAPGERCLMGTCRTTEPCSAAGTCTMPRDVCRNDVCIDRDSDLDGDGITAMRDCDEERADVHPGATETCDGADQDCDGTIDEGTGTSTFHVDADADGHGAIEGATIEACMAPAGYAATADDCDDASADIHPGAAERCNGADDDCDGTPDESGCPAGCVGALHIGHAYAFCPAAQTFAAAGSTCAAGGMRLARIDNASENDFVRNTATGRMLGDLWIGGSDTATEGSWVWPDGVQFWSGTAMGSTVGGRFASWAAGQPDEGAGGEDCLRMNGTPPGMPTTWADVSCGATSAFVCELW